MMNTRVKISRLAVVCVLCAVGMPAAYGAASVRSLGGAGTYSSASSASAARSASPTINSVRAGSARVTSGGGTSTTTGGNVRAASNSNPRLSVGKYLSGGKTISGGSSIKSQNPGSSVSSGGTPGGTDPALQAQVDQIEDRVEDLETLTSNQYTITEVDDLLDLKQDILTAGNGIEITNGVISAVSVAGTLVLLQNNGTHIQWKYDDASSTWQNLVALSEITGPQGIQGEKGEKGDKGDPGDAGDLSEYAKITDVNTALSAKADADLVDAALLSKADKSTTYTKTETDTALAGKADASTVYTKTETDTALAGKADASTLGDLAFKNTVGTTDIDLGGVTRDRLSQEVQEALTNAGAVDLTPYAKTDDVNTALADKADKSTVYTKTETDTALAGKADASTVYTKTETDTALADKADKSTVYTKTETDTALAGKADKSSLGDLATKDIVDTTDIANGSVTRDKLSQEVQEALTNAGAVDLTPYAKTDDVNTALADKADKSTVYTKTETDTALDGKADKTSLGALAAKSSVATNDIDDANVTRPKLALDVQTSLTRADNAVAKTGVPSDGTDYVLVINNGIETWMQVAY
ncbi:hypothetical protein LJC18_03455 [Lachnospiraceae bacterium OttesenSCG-928-E19]|nr:hypothetical protein [Lachnospiraceae bacterium OttesenSCG-928-E19]